MTSPLFDPSALAGNVLAAFASPFSQANRIVQLALAGCIAPDTKRWMRRFEDDSDWPAPEIRFMQPSPAAASNQE